MRPLFVALALSIAVAASAAQKTIQSPEEYNAYISALAVAVPADKAAAMEAFAEKYPASVVHIESLEQAMAAYQAVGDLAKVEDTAARILKDDPANVRALSLLTFLRRGKAAQGDKDAAAALGPDAARGLAALKTWTAPEEMSAAEAATLLARMREILEGGAGFAALQTKDYAVARAHYLKALAAIPDDFLDTYQLSIAELEAVPLAADGFWHAARAMQLAGANAAGRDAVEKYAKSKYKRYHGGVDGWDELVKAAAAKAAVPAGFAKSITKALTPAQIAVKAVRENDPATLSFSDYEFVLGLRDASPANKLAADKVWATIWAKEKRGKAVLRLDGVLVISATNAAAELSITDDDQAAKTPDLEVSFAKPLADIPAAGSTVTVQGVITGYDPKPFRFKMKDAALVAP